MKVTIVKWPNLNRGPSHREWRKAFIDGVAARDDWKVIDSKGREIIKAPTKVSPLPPPPPTTHDPTEWDMMFVSSRSAIDWSKLKFGQVVSFFEGRAFSTKVGLGEQLRDL